MKGRENVREGVDREHDKLVETGISHGAKGAGLGQNLKVQVPVPLLFRAQRPWISQIHQAQTKLLCLREGECA